MTSPKPRASFPKQSPAENADTASHNGRPKHLGNRSSGHWGRSPKAFHAALWLHMRRCGDSEQRLVEAAAAAPVKVGESAIRAWVRGTYAPRTHRARAFFPWLENRYGLSKGYFETKLFGEPDTPLKLAVKGRQVCSQTLLRWHIPDDFNQRTSTEQRDIMGWIEKNVLAGATEYGRYLRQACKHPFSVTFPELSVKHRGKYPRSDLSRFEENSGAIALSTGTVTAPRQLADELANLVEFKTSALTPLGFRRLSRWELPTVEKKVQQYGLFFGALTAHPKSNVMGLGLPLSRMSFGLLIFPALWDRYLDWSKKRRGFFTRYEQSWMHDLQSLSRPETGWLFQHPELAKQLKPISGLISSRDISDAKRNWDKCCARAHRFGKDRARDLKQVSRKHRDPFAPTLVVLNSDSPLREYRKIADEVLKRLPDEKRQPQAFAEGVRAYLLLRFGMHLGVRQRNLRDLLVCFRGNTPKSEGELNRLKCGEIRWIEAECSWEVFMPSSAFKNSHSPFFSGNPFRLLLPNLSNLYPMIDVYLNRHRPILLKRNTDPGTFFIKSGDARSKSAAYTLNQFYQAWRRTIQFYGIRNPYTGLGAIDGLLLHGPHGVRDVLATHVLKQTGSFELAAYAIQDTTRTVVEYYSRFLPHDKTAQAARILDRSWEDADRVFPDRLNKPLSSLLLTDAVGRPKHRRFVAPDK